MSALGLIGIKPDQVVLAADVANGLSPHSLGDIGQNVDNDGLKIYKWVKYEAATAAISGVAGEVAGYYLLDGYKTHTVTSDYSDTLDIGAGVMVAIMADGDEGWIQIKGPATLSLAFTAGVDGDPLTILGAGDGTLDLSALHTDVKCAHAGDASDFEIICDFMF